jgi:hypothetical protein
MVLSIQYRSLGQSESIGPFLGRHVNFSIFSRWTTRAHMSILITYLEFAWKIKFDEYDIIDM